MSSKRVRGNPGLRRGVGSKTTDSDEIMEDPPAGDWLTLRSDQLLEWIDNAVYNVAETTGMREVVNRVTRPIFNYGQRFSPHPLHFGIMCCAIEMGQASAPDHDIDRLGLVYRSSPRQCDVLLQWANVQYLEVPTGIPTLLWQVQIHSCLLMYIFQDVRLDLKL